MAVGNVVRCAVAFSRESGRETEPRPAATDDSISPQFQNSADTSLHRFHVVRGHLAETLQETFLGNGPNLIGNRYYGPAGTRHRYQKGWTRLRPVESGTITTVRRR